MFESKKNAAEDMSEEDIQYMNEIRQARERQLRAREIMSGAPQSQDSPPPASNAGTGNIRPADIAQEDGATPVVPGVDSRKPAAVEEPEQDEGVRALALDGLPNEVQEQIYSLLKKNVQNKVVSANDILRWVENTNNLINGNSNEVKTEEKPAPSVLEFYTASFAEKGVTPGVYAPDWRSLKSMLTEGFWAVEKHHVRVDSASILQFMGMDVPTEATRDITQVDSFEVIVSNGKVFKTDAE